ncbi:N-acetylmuramoyl-L-alanine amidase [Paenibacillus beijingensis]|uniref:SH3b domain-containing protein n=1 Tax=Paenibacillus beijingensis TaxID=1126833 RepID=A0A0D5NMP1_9BACL|nr:N-acetylmuramoyl-L-alanine amidase [Paenibacillus beijingensis]AJY76168.1 hypothetical protein VN24_18390 [Paenibacillus beijingensis]
MRRSLFGALVFALLLTGPQTGEAAGSSGVYRVAADSLNVREEPDGKARVVGVLKARTIVRVSDDQYGWVKVKAGETTGWAAGHYLKKADGAAVADASSGKSTSRAKSARSAASLGDSVRLRKGPGTGYEVIGSVNKGDRLTVLESEDGWKRVRTADGTVGWMSGQYVGSAANIEAVSAVKNVSSRTGSIRGKVIVIDPGHGGSDPGMIGTKHETLEKDLTLSTSVLVADRLRTLGAQVIMTRTKDSQKPALSERVRISEMAGADAFVSIHFNSSEQDTSGSLTFYYSKQKDERLARAIEGRLSQRIGLKSNGISFGDFHVLRENDTPSALVELGFLSNASDEEIVRTKSYQRKAAAAIVEGFKDYFE